MGIFSMKKGFLKILVTKGISGTKQGSKGQKGYPWTARARIHCLSEKGKNCSGKAKVRGRFSAGKVPVLTSIKQIKSQLFRSERMKLGREGKTFRNISDGKVIFFRNFEP